MLRFSEELLLLLLNEDAGDLAFVPEATLRHTLAGAALMDLALENRIDTDAEQLTVIDASPVGDELLDPALASIAESGTTHEAEYWVRRIAADGDRIRTIALERLVAAGILQSAEAGDMALSPKVARAHRYPTVEGEAEQEVRLRIMGVLFGDDIPAPRDIVIICLANACGMFERLLDKAELDEVRERLDLVGRMDLIGQAVTQAVRTSGREEAHKPAPAKEIPKVKGGLLLGSAREAARDVRALFTEQYLKLGPVFEVRLLQRRQLVLAGPEANQFVNRKGRLYLSSDPLRGVAEGFGAVRLVLNMDGKEHVAMRKAFAPAFSRAQFQGSLEPASQTVRRVVATWPQGRAIKPLYAVQEIIADQAGEVLAGEPCSEYLEDMVVFLKTVITTKIAKQLPMFLFARKFRKAQARVWELARKSLQSHRPGGPLHNSGDLISDLLDLHEADPQFMPEIDMIAMALGPYVLGIETVANTCVFTLYAILKHPDIRAQVVAEADEFFSGPLTAERLGEMDVTHRVVLESLRMYPAAPVFSRMVANSFDFAGYHIPAGVQVFVASTVTHRLPEFFPDPDRFDIDRYLPERAEHRQANAFVPFGLGHHRCLGSGLAETQTLLTIAAILHYAELEMDPPDYELKMINVPTPRPSKRFKFKVKRLR